MPDYSTVQLFLLRELDAEEASDFARLRRMPSTVVGRYLAAWAANSILHQAHPLPLEHEVVRTRFLDTVQGLPDLDPRLISMRLLKLTALVQREPEWGTAARFSADDLAFIAASPIAPSARIRKLIKPAFAAKFGLTPVNQGGGNWNYVRPNEDRGLRVHIDFGGTTWQLRYAVTHLGARRPYAQRNLEQCFGIPQAWDWISMDGAEKAVALLCECIEYVEHVASHL